MYGTVRNTGYGYSLFEFEVYGNNSTPLLTSIAVTPATATVQSGGTKQFTAQGKDQFGNNIAASFTWSAGGGTITSGGLYTAGAVAGTFTVSAKSGTVTGNASITVTISSSTNIALNKPATASSTQSGLSLGNVNDGNTTTRWSSNWEDPSWVTIDLQGNYAITKITLKWEAASGKNYLLQTSADNINWNTLQTVTNGDGGEDTYNVSGTGRYVRMYGSARNTGWGYSLWEFEVYGTPAGGRQSQNLNVSANKDEVTIQAYPNPVTDEVIISGMKSFPVTIQIYSGARLITERKYHKPSEIAVDMKHFAKGLYYIRVNEADKHLHTRRIVKE